MSWETVVGGAALSLVGGSVGGAAWNYIFETHVRPRREAAHLATALAAEILTNAFWAEQVALAIDGMAGETKSISTPPHRPMTKIAFEATVGRLGELSLKTARSLSALYTMFDGINTLVAGRAANYQSKPEPMPDIDRSIRTALDTTQNRAKRVVEELGLIAGQVFPPPTDTAKPPRWTAA